MINKIRSFIYNKISDKAMLYIGIVLLCVFYFIGLLSYITVPVPALFRLFKSSSILAILLRAFTCGLICLYSILVIFKYKPKIKWSWLVIFCFVLLSTLVCILISPLTYEYMYVEELYKVVHVVILNPGLGRTVVMFLSSIADFAFAFCILFVLPYVLNDKKKLLWLLLPIVAIGLLECCYSLFKERDLYIYLFNHPDDPFGGYGHEVGATFGNKEDWGAFLTVAISSSLCSIFFLGKTTKEFILKILLGVSAFIMSVFVVLSLCKTAMLGIFLLFITLFIGFIIASYFKSKRLAVICTSIFLVIICFAIVFFVTNGFGISFLSKICNYIKNFVFKRGSDALEGRSSLWLNYMENVRGYNLFFGMGKNYVNVYTKTLVPEGQSAIHNGFAYFFASYGLIGFIVLICLLCLVLRNILLNWRTNKLQTFLFLGVFAAALTFVLAESEVLIISSSTPIFVYNVLVVILPAALVLKNENNFKANLQND